ncbi:carbamoyltransferase HypF [Streptomyces sp. NPDC048389]|uniref:carbamoyltransferase HypF n=1 Tax=Streptomyces sp. NPDC048389 TaxID=3154622 RepID=UPI0034521CBF
MTSTLAGSQGRGILRSRISVHGTVQGVGFRPFVHRLASELGLSGFVHNTPGGVVVEVEGGPESIGEFHRRLREEPPPLADVREVRWEPVEVRGDGAFTIRASGRQEAGTTAIPPDTAPCRDCLGELADPRDRRYRHPFITCTHCGPRFTIATGLPYDRATTTMSDFPLCPLCAAEYEDPANRRFHAQPVACRSCGPQVRLTTAAGAAGGTRTPEKGTYREGDQAVAGARELLARGAVLAVKGLGGYHLACDARSPDAVAALRSRKERGGKPFAVMCADPATAELIAHVGPAEERVLTGPRRPIVLLRRRTDGPASGRLADAVCPGSPHVGVMLPYTPLHHLLFTPDAGSPCPPVLVMTSGNRSGSPIVTDDDAALSSLAEIADAWLWHDRVIAAPCDDSVVRVRPDGSELVLRRSRGYVPVPMSLPAAVPPVLAVGGDLKNTLCLSSGREAWFSPHIGDMDDFATQQASDHAEERLTALTGITPRLIAADLHPGYASARRAVRRGRDSGLPVHLVQHHHAHVVSLMAEHSLDGGSPLLGVAFDGTGYGTDGAVWGGEVLLADHLGFRRLAHLAYAPLPGGDAGVANPCRMALARLHTAGLAWDADLPCVAACSAEERRLLARQLERNVACVPTSSMGRLFDAVSSLAGVCHRMCYEAQAAVELESAATLAWEEPDDGAYTFGLAGPAPDGITRIEPAPVLRGIIADLRRDVPVPVVAARFHRAVAAAVTDICRIARRETGTDTVGLTGGVFANALLDEECAARLTAAGFTVLRHHRVPPGDGGLALGQLLVATAQDARSAGEHPRPANNNERSAHVPGSARQSGRNR